VTTGGNDSAQFAPNQPLLVQYILKPQPLTRGDYTLTVTPPAGLRICKVVMPFVGRNMPCTYAPPNILTGTINAAF
jgi:hypothetical protein